MTFILIMLFFVQNENIKKLILIKFAKKKCVLDNNITIALERSWTKGFQHQFIPALN